MVAEIIAVGTELLLGEILNSDSQFLAQELSKLGIDVFYQTVVGDNEARLTQTIQTALSRSDLVITSGGLGPTHDDITKETLAAAMGVEMKLDEACLRDMEAYFARLNRPMAQVNVKQAVMPVGCIVLKNNNGTAPGGIIEKDGKIAIFLPGPPNEIVPMYHESVAPYLAAKSEEILFSKTLRIIGIGESSVEEKLSDFMRASTNPTVAPYAKTDEVTLRITAKCKSEDEAAALIAPAEEKIRAVLGDAVYGVDDDTIFAAVCRLLKEKNMKIAFAESCTGGLLAEKLTSVPGASEVLEQSFVTYSVRAKHDLLGVNEVALSEFGAVSEQVACAMAEGVKKRSSADIGVSVTGVAGPDSDEKGNPVGLVYVGVAGTNGTEVKKFTFAGSRERIRTRACVNAYAALRDYLVKRS